MADAVHDHRTPRSGARQSSGAGAQRRVDTSMVIAFG
jgi:hypothetical protein